MIVNLENDRLNLRKYRCSCVMVVCFLMVHNKIIYDALTYSSCYIPIEWYLKSNIRYLIMYFRISETSIFPHNSVYTANTREVRSI